jgi:hypothetical protein
MNEKTNGFSSGTGKAFLTLGFLQLVLATGAQAWTDYGWLGLIVYIILAIPAAPIFFLAGWFFLPFASMVWVYVFAALGLAFIWFSAKGDLNV